MKQQQPRLWLLLSVGLTTIFFNPILLKAQELPKGFDNKVLVEYSCFMDDEHLCEHEDEFKLTFEEYHELRKGEYLSERKFLEQIANSKSFTNLCDNGTFESGEINVADWQFYWFGGASSTSFPSAMFGTNRLNTGSFNSGGTPDLQVHHQVQSAGADDYVTAIDKVYSFPAGNTMSLRLGNANRQYGKESVAKQVQITAANADLSFSYAVVMNDPAGHNNSKPYFAVEIINSSTMTPYTGLVDLGNGDNTLPSDHPLLISSDLLIYGDTVVYKDWTCVTADLSSLIGEDVIIKFETRDCWQGAHMGYAYVDNICLGCGGAPSDEGAIDLNLVQTDSCSLPGQICVDYDLPLGNLPSLDISLDLIQNGSIVSTLNSPTLTSNSLYCFDLDAANTAGLDPSLGGFDYRITGNFTLGAFNFTPQIIGTIAEGVTELTNNDYLLECPPEFPVCGCEYELKAYDPVTLNEGGPYTNSVIINGDRISMEVLWEVIETCDGGAPTVIDTYTTNELSIALSLTVYASSVNQYASLPVVDNGVPTNVAIPNFNAANTNDYVDSIAVYLNNLNLGATFTTTGSIVYHQVESSYTGGFQFISPVSVNRSSCSNCTINDSYSTPCGDLQYAKTASGLPTPPSNYLNYVTITYNSMVQDTNLTVSEGGANGGHNTYLDCTEPCPEICDNGIDDDGDELIDCDDPDCEDTEPPMITCPEDIMMSTDPGVCDAVVTWADPVAVDNCDNVIPNSFYSSGDTFPLGTTTVSYTVTDSAGNVATCDFDITVEDNEPPIASCISVDSMPAVQIDLGMLDGTNGLTLNGIDGSDLSGYSVSNAGDVNNDGFSDVIIGASQADPNGNSAAGEIYVVYGGNSIGSTTDLSTLTPAQGFTIYGIDAADQSGNSVSTAGDVNNDGFSDIVIGASQADPNGNSSAGESYVIYGGNSIGSTIDLSTLTPSQGFTINGINTDDQSGNSVSSAGDVNNDGFSDIVIGAYTADPNGNSSAGESYVIYGGNSIGGTIDLSTLSPTQGFIINGINSSDWSAYSVSGAGDVNNDGFSDVIIGARYANSNAGESYVIYGGNSIGGTIELSTLSPAQGFLINGIDGFDNSGNSVSSAGDVNNDGFSDIIIGAEFADPNGNSNAGESYVLYGGNSIGGTVDLSTLSPAQGFIINGIDIDDRSGLSVSGAGDVNNDGFSDIIIGAQFADPNGNTSGESYVIYGGNSIGSAIDLSTLSSAQGFIINGIDAGDWAGCSVSSAGDVNNDGFSDIIIGARQADPNGNSSAGESYVIYGGNFVDGSALTLQLDANSMASISPADIDDGSSDNCGIASMTVSPNTFDCSNIGENTVVLTVTDTNGNSSTCSTTVTIEDNELPMITCPANISVSTDPGVCDAVVTWSNPVTTDNCGVASVTSTHNSGDTFPLGTTTVSYTVTDDAGNVATCDFDITVEDNEPPIITCPEDITVTADAGAIDAVVTWTLPTTSDNCPGTTLTSLQNSGDTFPVGTTTVNYTVTDDAGNMATCDFDVIVETSFPSSCLSFDGNDDNITAPNTPLNSIGTGDFTFETWIQADAVGQSSHPIIFSNRPSSGSGVMFFLHNQWNGSAVKMLTVQLGGSNYFVYNNGPNAINVLDGNCHHLAISRQGNLLTHYIDGEFIGTRNISGTPSVSSGNSNMLIGREAFGSDDFLGHISDVRIWNVARTGTEIQSSAGTFLTGTEPNLVANWPLNENTGQTVADISSNGYDGTLGTTAASESSDPTWGENCCSTCEAELVLDGDFDDPACPTFTSGLDQNCACDQSWCIETDPLNKCVASGWINLAAPAGASPNYLIVDGYNTGTGMIWSQLVQVEAGTSYEFSFWYYPNISSNSSTPNLDIRLDGAIFGNTSGIASTWTEFTFSVLASTTGLVSLEIYQTNDGIYNDFAIDNISFLGGCTPTDPCVIGVDCEPPTITCPPDITVSTPNGACISPVTWSTPVTTDNCAVASVTSTHDSGDTFVVGTTTVTYTVTDDAGNVATCSFDITLEDNQLPTITCPADITISTDPGVCDAVVTWNEPVTADNCVFASANSFYSSGDTFPLGTTTVIYTVTDNSGNVATCSFDITVEDTEPPTITCPADIMVSTAPGVCEAVVTWNEPVTDDNCLVDGANSLYSSGDSFPLGTTTVIYVVTDDTGNEATCSFDITVEDTEPPTISCPADIMVSTAPGVCDAVATWSVPVTTDNCAVASVSSTHNSGDTFPLGLTTVIYTVTDDAGNVATCDFNVTVEDNEPPTIICPEDIIVTADEGAIDAVVTWTLPTTSDNCPGTTLTSLYNSGDAFPIGTTTVNYTVTDASGNVATCDFEVTVEEFIPSNCLYFDGNDDRITAPNAGLNSIGSGDFTFETWIQADAAGQSSHPIIFSNRPSSGSGVMFFLHNQWNGSAVKMLTVQLGGSNYFVYNNGPNAINVLDGNCHHLAISRQGNLLTHYIDGEFIGTRNISGTPSVSSGNSNMLIGREAFGSDDFLGHISDIRIWNVARTATEIQNTADIALLGTETDLVANWKLEEGGGQVVFDNSTNAYDGVLGSNTSIETTDPAWGQNCCNVCEMDAFACYDFNDLTPTNSYNTNSAGNWTAMLSDIGIFSGSIDGSPYLQANDNSGSSWIYNNIDFSGDWLQEGCELCFDYNFVSSDGCPTNTRVSVIHVYQGSSPVSATLRAVFRLNDPIVVGSGWRTVCIPIENCYSGIDLPSNGEGEWLWSSGGTDCTDFNNLLGNVSGIGFAIDNSCSLQSETHAFDNLCFVECCDPCYPIELVVDGDFDDPTGASFTSGLLENCVCDPESWCIDTDPLNKCTAGGWNSLAAPAGNSPNFLIFDGFNNPPGVVWSQPVSVEIGRTYEFSFWYYPDMTGQSTNNLEIRLDGVTFDNTSGVAGTWTEYTFSVEATTTGTIPLEIIQTNSGTYNDFGIDGISFHADCGVVDPCDPAVDTEPPTITCPEDIIVPTAPGACYAIVMWNEPLATDNCAVATISSTQNSGEAFLAGTTTVMYTVTDDAGNVTTCSFEVTVEDNEAPTFICPPDISISTELGTCDAMATWELILARDNCDVVPTISSTHNSGDVFPLGITTVSYTVTDDAGNVTTCDFDIEVLGVDIAPPTITCPPDETVTCVDNIMPSIENAIIGTSCGANATVSIINLDEVGEMNCPGSVCTFTYQIEDEYGGIATCEQVYTFDNPPPTITCPSGGLIPCSYSIDDINVDPSDAIVISSCGIDYTVVISDTIIQPGDGTAAFSFSSNLGNTIPNCLGTQYIFVYTVEDACGREASCEQVFTLSGEPITIECPEDQVVNSTDEIFVDSANAILGGSSCGGASVEISGPIISGGTNCLDSIYTYIYQVVDSCGFTGLSCEQTFTILSNPLPLEITGDLEVCLGDPTVLTVTGGSGNYTWSQGGTQVSTGSSIVFAPNQVGNYPISVYDNNCQLSDNVVVMVEDCCVDTLYVGQTIASGLYPAIQKVISDGKVQPGSNVDFTAENIDIELNVGFCVEPGAIFSAEIEPCEGDILTLNNNLNTAINFTTTSYTGELQLYLPEKTNLQVNVYNQKTNQVYHLVNEEIRKQGIHEYLLDLSELPTGNYRLELNTGKETYTEEFIINKL